MPSQNFSSAATFKLFFRECKIQANSLIILAATFSIFAIDLHLPLGVAAGTPYVLVVFASLWVSGIQFTYLIAALGIIFAITGYFLSPSIGEPVSTSIILFNRGITLLLIICSAIMVIKIKKANIDISNLISQVLIDRFTGYKNRQAFEAELDTEILRCKRYHRNLSVAIVDIDLYKLFSDNYYFRNKNDSIKTIPQEIKANIRTSDLFYRIDINVFAILFPETGLVEAKEVCEAIRKKVSAKIAMNTENKITISIGIATLTEADKRINLCKRAEDALFISKSNGGNFVATVPEVVNKDKTNVAAILSRSRAGS